MYNTIKNKQYKSKDNKVSHNTCNAKYFSVILFSQFQPFWVKRKWSEKYTSRNATAVNSATEPRVIIVAWTCTSQENVLSENLLPFNKGINRRVSLGQRQTCMPYGEIKCNFTKRCALSKIVVRSNHSAKHLFPLKQSCLKTDVFCDTFFSLAV